MKAKTIKLTATCEYCGCPLTYKSQEGFDKGVKNGHLHSICKKEIKKAKEMFKGAKNE